MTRLLFLLLILLQLSGCTQPSDERSLSGKWRENKKLTLESAGKSPSATKEFLDVLTSKSFGNEIYEFKDNKVRLSVAETGAGYDFVGEFRNFEILEESSDSFIIYTYDIVFEKNTKQKLYWHNNCFYLYQQKRQYNHYYCRENGL